MWTLAAGDPQSLSLSSFEETADGWATSAHGAFCCFWKWWSTAWVSVWPLFAQLCCLVTTAWWLQQTKISPEKLLLYSFHLQRQERHQSCKFITTLLILPGNHRGGANLCLWAFHTPWKDSCPPSLRGEYLWVAIFSYLMFHQLVIALHGDEACVCVGTKTTWWT